MASTNNWYVNLILILNMVLLKILDVQNDYKTEVMQQQIKKHHVNVDGMYCNRIILYDNDN